MTRSLSFRFHSGQLACVAKGGIVTVCMLLLSLRAPLALGQAPDNSGFVTVRMRPVTPLLDAYAQVEPIAVLSVSAGQTGVVAGLKVVPGMHVRAGQELAHLNGPEIDSMLSQSRSTLDGAQKQLLTSEKVLATQQQQLASQLTTRQVVSQAEGSVAQSRTAVENAQFRLNAVRQLITLSSPSDAIVLALNSTDGSLVTVGQPILTLQPNNRLWLKATYYGTDLDAIHVGMTGRFVPTDGSAPVPIKVSAVFGALSADGGASIAMVPTIAKTNWLNGQFGRVSLNAPQHSLVAVPTRALILDQGKWWVMLHTPQGNRPQEVVPGSSEGWDTFIEQGLQPGAEVVVENAYLLFHQGISQRYQIPS